MVKLSPAIAVKMSAFILTCDTLSDVLQSVTPFLGEPESYGASLEFRENKGDLAAKDEAMEMLCGCDRCEEVAASPAAKKSAETVEESVKAEVSKK